MPKESCHHWTRECRLCGEVRTCDCENKRPHHFTDVCESCVTKQGTEKIRAYPELNQKGMILIESELKVGCYVGELGVQVATDGRVWVCIDGLAAIRFSPESRYNEKELYEKESTQEKTAVDDSM